MDPLHGPKSEEDVPPKTTTTTLERPVNGVLTYANAGGSNPDLAVRVSEADWLAMGEPSPRWISPNVTATGCAEQERLTLHMRVGDRTIDVVVTNVSDVDVPLLYPRGHWSIQHERAKCLVIGCHRLDLGAKVEILSWTIVTPAKVLRTFRSPFEIVEARAAQESVPPHIAHFRRFLARHS